MRSEIELILKADRARLEMLRGRDAALLGYDDAEVVEAMRYFEGVEEALRWATGHHRRLGLADQMSADIDRAQEEARNAAERALGSEDPHVLVDGARIIPETDPGEYGAVNLFTAARRAEFLKRQVPDGWTAADVLTAITAGITAGEEVQDDGPKVDPARTAAAEAIELMPHGGERRRAGAPATSTGPRQRCSGCHRYTWAKSEFDGQCGMPQPTGPACTGRFQPTST